MEESRKRKVYRENSNIQKKYITTVNFLYVDETDAAIIVVLAAAGVSSKVLGVVAHKVAASGAATEFVRMDNFLRVAVAVAVAAVAATEVFVVEGWDHSKIRRFGQRCKKKLCGSCGPLSLFLSVPLCSNFNTLNYFFFSMNYTVDGCWPTTTSQVFSRTSMTLRVTDISFIKHK